MLPLFYPGLELNYIIHLPRETCINFEDDRRNLFLDTKSNDTADKNTKKFDITELTGVCNKAVIVMV
jgi:hypothetical protein